MTANSACSASHSRAVQNLQAVLGGLIGSDVVDADLQVVETGLVQAVDPVGGQQIAVGNERGDGAAPPDVTDDFIQLGVEHRFPAADGNDGSSEISQQVDAPQHLGGGHGSRHRVELVAVGAGKVAAPDGHDVSDDRVMRGVHSARKEARLPQPTAYGTLPAPESTREVPPLRHPFPSLRRELVEAPESPGA